MKKLTGKVALITGAANGLGKALAMELFSRGCHLALVDIDLKDLKKLKNLLHLPGQQVSIHSVDVTNENKIVELRNEMLSIHKHLDILINNAAISNSQPFMLLDMADFKALFEVNFWGYVYLTKYFLNDLKSRDRSFLVNIISDFALLGFPGKTSYGSSKAAVMSFTNALRTELCDGQIKLSLVIPPPMSTDLVKKGKHIDDEKRNAELEFISKNAMSVEDAAKIIVSKFLQGRYRILVGWKTYWIDFFIRCFPELIFSVIKRIKSRIEFVK